jgi:hypothetical protein
MARVTILWSIAPGKRYTLTMRSAQRHRPPRSLTHARPNDTTACDGPHRWYISRQRETARGIRDIRRESRSGRIARGPTTAGTPASRPDYRAVSDAGSLCCRNAGYRGPADKGANGRRSPCQRNEHSCSIAGPRAEISGQRRRVCPRRGRALLAGADGRLLVDAPMSADFGAIFYSSRLSGKHGANSWTASARARPHSRLRTAQTSSTTLVSTRKTFAFSDYMTEMAGRRGRASIYKFQTPVVVDVGGGEGRMLASILRQIPGCADCSVGLKSSGPPDHHRRTGLSDRCELRSGGSSRRRTAATSTSLEHNSRLGR